MREPLEAGTRLGRYEIQALVGAGGMGEVYRARDHELGRAVAIKVLPAAFAESAERLRRFELEARAAAALNHPNILAVFDVGQHDGTPYLVSELLEGQSLRARLEGAALPIRKAVEFGIQIAEGLAAAHDKGIVHRDLKPENIFVTRDERLKILDFGLAKLLDVDLGTLTAPPQTSDGAVLGTVGYLSPEQASGQPADHRSDIFSLGVMLFEMVTHRRAFARATAAQTLTAVLEDDPTAAVSTGSGSGARVMNLVRRCLEKAPERRFQSARDLSLILSHELLDSPSQPGLRRVRQPRLATLALALACLATGAFLGRGRLRSTEPTAGQVVSFSIPLRAGDSFTPYPIAVSSDGTHLVYAANHEGRSRLYLRALSRNDEVALAGTEDASSPVFSPDGKHVAFMDRAEGRLKRISIGGGVPSVVCDAPDPLGLAWGIDDYIVFAAGVRTGLSRVSASGGTPEQVTGLDAQHGDISHRSPHVMDDGTILFVVRTGAGSRIDAASPRTGEHRTVIADGSFVRSIGIDRLVYMNSHGETFVARYDARTMSVQGAPIALPERPQATGTYGDFALAIARGGTLAYVPFEAPRRLMTVAARDGSIQTLGAEPKDYWMPRVSPDGRRIAVHINVGINDSDVWVFDREREMLTRVTTNRYSLEPLWDSTGKTLTFVSREDAGFSLRSKVVDSSSASTVVLTTRDGASPVSWLPDGRTLLFGSWASTAPAQQPVFLAAAGSAPRPIDLPPSRAGRYVQGLSPDGRWLAYISDESGRWEAYVTAFPGPGTTRMVSRGGGVSVRWGKTGTDLFYRRPPSVNPPELMKVTIRADGTASQPVLVATVSGLSGLGAYGPGYAFYDTFPDGSLLVLKDERPPAPPRIEVTVNWSTERAPD